MQNFILFAVTKGELFPSGTAQIAISGEIESHFNDGQWIITSNTSLAVGRGSTLVQAYLNWILHRLEPSE